MTSDPMDCPECLLVWGAALEDAKRAPNEKAKMDFLIMQQGMVEGFHLKDHHPKVLMAGLIRLLVKDPFKSKDDGENSLDMAVEMMRHMKMTDDQIRTFLDKEGVDPATAGYPG